MTLRIRLKRRRGRSGLWHFTRFLFLVIGLGALGYTGWFYAEQSWHQYRTSQTFDQNRLTLDRQQGALDPPRARVVPPPSASPFPARLTIARLHLTTMIEEGVGDATLRRAAGHIPSTALPGHSGNVGVAGHRDTLFRPLRQIKAHDRIVISTLSNNYDYEVTGTSIVSPDNVSVLASAPGENTLTLVTCYPFYYVGSAPDRFIVKARQVSPNLPEQQVTEMRPETPPPAIPVARQELDAETITREPNSVDHNPGPRKVHFEVPKSHSRELSPGISMGLTDTDVAGRRVDGWMWVMPDRRTIQLRHQNAQQPLVFYRDGGKRELVITKVAANSVSGYLIVPADRQQNVSAKASAPRHATTGR